MHKHLVTSQHTIQTPQNTIQITQHKIQTPQIPQNEWIEKLNNHQYTHPDNVPPPFVTFRGTEAKRY